MDEDTLDDELEVESETDEDSEEEASSPAHSTASTPPYSEEGFFPPTSKSGKLFSVRRGRGRPKKDAERKPTKIKRWKSGVYLKGENPNKSPRTPTGDMSYPWTNKSPAASPIHPMECDMEKMEKSFPMPAPDDPPVFTEAWPGKLCALCGLSERTMLGQREMIRQSCPDGFPSKANSGSASGGDKSPRAGSLNAQSPRSKRREGKSATELLDELSLVGYIEEPEYSLIVEPSGTFYVHYSCIAWSSGVKRSGDGEQNMEGAWTAVDAALFRRCGFCTRLGASIGCSYSHNNETCSIYFHYPCAVASSGLLDPSTHTLICNLHLDHVTRLPVAERLQCGTCLSLGNVSNLVMCSQCDVHYHGSCVGVALQPTVRAGWQCLDCRMCQVCRNPAEVGKVMLCETCDKSYHPSCLRPIVTSIPKYGWKCKCCRVCSDCGSRTPGSGLSSRWHNHFSVCDSCYQQRNKGICCPVCGKAYRAAAHREMVKCTKCAKFVHGTCDPDADLATYTTRKEATPEYEYICTVCKTTGGRPFTKRKDSMDDGVDGSFFSSQESMYGDESMDIDQVEKGEGGQGMGKGKQFSFNSAKKRFGPGRNLQKMKAAEICKKRGIKSKMRGVFGVPGLGLQRPQAEPGKNDEEPGIENRMVLCSGDDRFVTTQDMCVMCGALGTDQEGCLIACVQCGQCYHPYCVNVKVTKVILTKGWRCLDCTVCEGCGQRNDDARLTLCDECDISYHIYCMDPPLESVPRGVWKCKWCVVCLRCGTNDAGVNCSWMNKYTECGPCASHTACAMCGDPYNENELVIQCEECSRWLHGACDSIRNENDAEMCAADGYICGLCRPRDVPPPHLYTSMSGPEPSIYDMEGGRQSQTQFFVDGTCLTEAGMGHIKAMTLETTPIQRKKPRKKPLPALPVPAVTCEKEARYLSTIESVVTGNACLELEDVKEEIEYREGMEIPRGDDGKAPEPPEGFTIYTTESGALILRRKRTRNLQKQGIGGFLVRVRTVRKEDDGDEKIEGMIPLEKPKRKPIRRKPRSKIAEAYPTYLQDAFFGRDLLDAPKEKPESSSDSERDDGAKVTDDKTIELSNDELKVMANLKAKQADIKVKADQIKEEDEGSDSEVLNDLNLKDLPLPGDLLDNELVDTLMAEEEDIKPNTEETNIASAAIPGANKDELSDILSPHFNLESMVRDSGLPDMDGKDVEEIFKEVLTDDARPAPNVEMTVQTAMTSPVVLPASFPPVPSPYHSEYSNSPHSQVSEPASPWLDEPPLSIEPPTPTSTSSSSRTTPQKMEADEALGLQATISSVLYANTNHPEWKTQFPVWSDRYKQILKKWRTLSNDQKAPYLQHARDNRSAVRMKKAQQIPKESPIVPTTPPLPSLKTASVGSGPDTTPALPATAPEEDKSLQHQQKTSRECEQERQWKQLQALRHAQQQQQQQVIHDQRMHAMTRINRIMPDDQTLPPLSSQLQLSNNPEGPEPPMSPLPGIRPQFQQQNPSVKVTRLIPGQSPSPFAAPMIPRSMRPTVHPPMQSPLGEHFSPDESFTPRFAAARSPAQFSPRGDQFDQSPEVARQLRDLLQRQKDTGTPRPWIQNQEASFSEVPDTFRQPLPPGSLLRPRMAGQQVMVRAPVRQAEPRMQAVQEHRFRLLLQQQQVQQQEHQSPQPSPTSPRALPTRNPMDPYDEIVQAQAQQRPTEQSTGPRPTAPAEQQQQEIPENVTAELEQLEQEGGPMTEVEAVSAILGDLADDDDELLAEMGPDFNILEYVDTEAGPGDKTNLLDNLDLHDDEDKKTRVKAEAVQGSVHPPTAPTSAPMTDSVPVQGAPPQPAPPTYAPSGQRPMIPLTGGTGPLRMPGTSRVIVGPGGKIIQAGIQMPNNTRMPALNVAPPPPYPGPPPPYPGPAQPAPVPQISPGRFGSHSPTFYPVPHMDRRPLLLQEQPLLLEDLLEQEKREQEKQQVPHVAEVEPDRIPVLPSMPMPGGMVQAPPQPGPMLGMQRPGFPRPPGPGQYYRPQAPIQEVAPPPPPRIATFNIPATPPPPLPPDVITTEVDRQAVMTYETWMNNQNQLLQQQLKYYETEVQKLRKVRKSLNSKKRQQQKNGNELNDNDAMELQRITTEQAALQKHLDASRKACRQHGVLMQEFHTKQQKNRPQGSPHSPMHAAQSPHHTMGGSMAFRTSPHPNTPQSPMMSPSPSPLHSPGPGGAPMQLQQQSPMSPHSRQPSPRMGTPHSQVGEDNPFSPGSLPSPQPTGNPRMPSPRLVASPGLQDAGRLHTMSMGPRFVRAPAQLQAGLQGSVQRLVYTAKPGTAQPQVIQRNILYTSQQRTQQIFQTLSQQNPNLTLEQKQKLLQQISQQQTHDLEQKVLQIQQNPNMTAENKQQMLQKLLLTNPAPAHTLTVEQKQQLLQQMQQNPNMTPEQKQQMIQQFLQQNQRNAQLTQLGLSMEQKQQILQQISQQNPNLTPEQKQQLLVQIIAQQRQRQQQNQLQQQQQQQNQLQQQQQNQLQQQQTSQLQQQQQSQIQQQQQNQLQQQQQNQLQQQQTQHQQQNQLQQQTQLQQQNQLQQQQILQQNDGQPPMQVVQQAQMGDPNRGTLGSPQQVGLSAGPDQRPQVQVSNQVLSMEQKQQILMQLQQNPRASPDQKQFIQQGQVIMTPEQRQEVMQQIQLQKQQMVLSQGNAGPMVGNQTMQTTEAPRPVQTLTLEQKQQIIQNSQNITPEQKQNLLQQLQQQSQNMEQQKQRLMQLQFQKQMQQRQQLMDQQAMQQQQQIIAQQRSMGQPMTPEQEMAGPASVPPAPSPSSIPPPPSPSGGGGGGPNAPIPRPFCILPGLRGGAPTWPTNKTQTTKKPEEDDAANRPPTVQRTPQSSTSQPQPKMIIQLGQNQGGQSSKRPSLVCVDYDSTDETPPMSPSKEDKANKAAEEKPEEIRLATDAESIALLEQENLLNLELEAEDEPEDRRVIIIENSPESKAGMMEYDDLMVYEDGDELVVLGECEVLEADEFDISNCDVLQYDSTEEEEDPVPTPPTAQAPSEPASKQQIIVRHTKKGKQIVMVKRGEEGKDQRHIMYRSEKDDTRVEVKDVKLSSESQPGPSKITSKAPPRSVTPVTGASSVQSNVVSTSSGSVTVTAKAAAPTTAAARTPVPSTTGSSVTRPSITTIGSSTPIKHVIVRQAPSTPPPARPAAANASLVTRPTTSPVVIRPTLSAPPRTIPSPVPMRTVPSPVPQRTVPSPGPARTVASPVPVRSVPSPAGTPPPVRLVSSPSIASPMRIVPGTVVTAVTASPGRLTSSPTVVRITTSPTVVPSVSRAVTTAPGTLRLIPSISPATSRPQVVTFPDALKGTDSPVKISTPLVPKTVPSQSLAASSKPSSTPTKNGAPKHDATSSSAITLAGNPVTAVTSKPTQVNPIVSTITANSVPNVISVEPAETSKPPEHDFKSQASSVSIISNAKKEEAIPTMPTMSFDFPEGLASKFMSSKCSVIKNPEMETSPIRPAKTYEKSRHRPKHSLTEHDYTSAQKPSKTELDESDITSHIAKIDPKVRDIISISKITPDAKKIDRRKSMETIIKRKGIDERRRSSENKKDLEHNRIMILDQMKQEQKGDGSLKPGTSSINVAPIVVRADAPKQSGSSVHQHSVKTEASPKNMTTIVPGLTMRSPFASLETTAPMAAPKTEHDLSDVIDILENIDSTTPSRLLSTSELQTMEKNNLFESDDLDQSQTKPKTEEKINIKSLLNESGKSDLQMSDLARCTPPKPAGVEPKPPQPPTPGNQSKLAALLTGGKVSDSIMTPDKVFPPDNPMEISAEEPKKSETVPVSPQQEIKRELNVLVSPTSGILRTTAGQHQPPYSPVVTSTQMQMQPNTNLPNDRLVEIKKEPFMNIGFQEPMMRFSSSGPDLKPVITEPLMVSTAPQFVAPVSQITASQPSQPTLVQRSPMPTMAQQFNFQNAGMMSVVQDQMNNHHHTSVISSFPSQQHLNQVPQQSLSPRILVATNNLQRLSVPSVVMSTSVHPSRIDESQNVLLKQLLQNTGCAAGASSPGLPRSPTPSSPSPITSPTIKKEPMDPSEVKIDSEELKKLKRRQYQQKRRQSQGKECATPKKRARKGSRMEEDFESYTEGLMSQLKNLPPLPIMEPYLPCNFGVCPPFGAGDSPPPTEDYYSIEPFGDQLKPPPKSPVSTQRGFYDQEFSSVQLWSNSDERRMEVLLGCRERDTDTPDTIVSSSSPECGRCESPLRFPALQVIKEESEQDHFNRASPPIPIVVPIPIRPRPASHAFKHPLKATEIKQENKENMVDGDVKVTLTINSDAAKDVMSVLKDLASLLNIAPPTQYQIVERTTTPPSMKLGLYRNRSKDGKEGAPVDIQSILNGQAKFCKHCDVVVLAGAIKKKVWEVPFLAKREDLEGCEEVYFCGSSCYMQFSLMHKSPNEGSDRPGSIVDHTGQSEGTQATPVNTKPHKGNRYKFWQPGCLQPATRYKKPTERELMDMLFRAAVTLAPTPNTDDSRRCLFCNQVGDGVADGPARLLNFDVDKWVHLNCALWSDDVYERVNGALMNVDNALQQGQTTTCSLCGLLGATLHCFKVRCSNVYHLSCAVKDECVFFKNKTTFCPAHVPKNDKDNELTTLSVYRRVYVQRDEERQVATVMHNSELNNLMRVGSLIFLSVGQLLPHQLHTFHTSNYIYPVGYKITRFYWSMRRVNKRCPYICSIHDAGGRPEFRILVQEQGYEDIEFRDSSARAVFLRILEPLQALRKQNGVVHLFPRYVTGEDLFGLTEPAVVRVLESLPGVETLNDYKFKYGRNPLLELPLAVNPTGCARSEPRQKNLVPFKRPHTQRTGTVSRPNLYSPSLPGEPVCPYSKQFVHSKSSQYKKMKLEWRNNVYLARSKIQGLGLYAARDLERHTMVIEYIGEIIRHELSERREKQYEARNRGIYMFRMDEERVVDATISGGLARYINHSCNPNCVTEIVEVDRELRIIIFAKRRIPRGEELAYDYKFDIEDDQHKIPCLCGAPNCRKWMN